jgi:nickel superoxide dismutase
MISNKRKFEVIASLVFLSLLVIFAFRVFSHCEIPCGIYDDEMRIKMMAEHVATIEKSMNQIQLLSEEVAGLDPQDMNQMVRWIQNKEKHAEDLVHIVTQYFMTQRVKPFDEKDSEEYGEYVKKLTLLHQMMFYAMKSKQTTDLANVEKLKSLLDSFEDAYFGPERHIH